MIGAIAGLLQVMERAGWIRLPAGINYYQMLTVARSAFGPGLHDIFHFWLLVRGACPHPGRSVGFLFPQMGVDRIWHDDARHPAGRRAHFDERGHRPLHVLSAPSGFPLVLRGAGPSGRGQLGGFRRGHHQLRPLAAPEQGGKLSPSSPIWPWPRSSCGCTPACMWRSKWWSS